MAQFPTPSSERSRLALALSFLSGVCGLGYEVLYTRLLTTYLGDMLVVAGAVLASFLVGLGLGSILAKRLVRWLWLVEAAIGAYGIGVAMAAPKASKVLLGTVLGWAEGSGFVTVAVVSIALLVPSLLIGTSVPLFAQYVDRTRPTTTSSEFEWVYVLYNFGAALCVLAVEFLLLRTLGIQLTTLLVASANLVTALTLRFAVQPPLPPLPITGEHSRHADAVACHVRRLRASLVALFVAGALSAIYQLLALRLVQSLFGPFHENFALVLALVMVGLTVGTLVVRRWHPSLAGLLLAGALVLAASLAVLGDLARLWARLSELAGATSSVRLGAKAMVIGAMTLPAFAMFGATVPALLREQRQANPGTTLAVASFGNCAGYLAAVLVLMERFETLDLLLGIVGATFVIGLVLRRGPRSVRALMTTVAVALMGVTAVRFPARYLYFSYDDFLTPDRLESIERSVLAFESVRNQDSELAVVSTRTGAELVKINGYLSLVASANGRVNHREVMVGLAPAAYAPTRERVLVLGTGTGITAGTAALMFDRARVVEINPAVYEALPRFASHNFDLASMKNVDFVLADGLNVLASSTDDYDVIISTVTSPIYFSSSKLYTAEFFDLVSSRLRPGGAFAFWFDNRLSVRGLSVMLQTMAASFAECHFVFLGTGYYEVICGERLAPHPLPPEAYPVQLRHAVEPYFPGMDLAQILDSVLLRPTRFREVEWSSTVNTFDRPVLEAIMARELVGAAATWDLDEELAFNLEGSVFGGHSFADLGLADRCHALALMGGGAGIPRCRARIEERFGADGLRRLLHLSRAARDHNTRGALGGQEIVQGYYALGEPERALEFLMSEPPRRGAELALLAQRLEAQLRVLGDVSDQDLARLVAWAPTSPDVRRLLVRVALARDDLPHARAHLHTLARLTALTKEEATLLARLIDDVRRGSPPEGSAP